MEPIFAYARLNERIMPLDRGERYEDPLQEALEESGFGTVTGGGTMMTAEKEIDYCGVDIELVDVANGVPFVCKFLASRGAPKGSVLEYDINGQKHEVLFGTAEGVAIYLNGTDLPNEVYQQCDVNELYDEINRLLGEEGGIRGHWSGPTETALYLYGDSADLMVERISAYIKGYPLCQRARVVRIA